MIAHAFHANKVGYLQTLAGFLRAIQPEVNALLGQNVLPLPTMQGVSLLDTDVRCRDGYLETAFNVQFEFM